MITKEEKRKELEKLLNIGKSTSEKLVEDGIDTPNKLRKLGAEESFLIRFQKHGWEVGMCSCYLYALEGAITGERWNEIPDKRKKELRKYVKDLRESFRS